MMAFCPEHPKWDQNSKFTPLSETRSIPTPPGSAHLFSMTFNRWTRPCRLVFVCCRDLLSLTTSPFSFKAVWFEVSFEELSSGICSSTFPNHPRVCPALKTCGIYKRKQKLGRRYIRSSKSRWTESQKKENSHAWKTLYNWSVSH